MVNGYARQQQGITSVDWGSASYGISLMISSPSVGYQINQHSRKHKHFSHQLLIFSSHCNLHNVLKISLCVCLCLNAHLHTQVTNFLILVRKQPEDDRMTVETSS
jgi:hypothetical protein